MQPSNLPLELLQKVLQKVDVPQRLCCGVVCKAWHAAAVAATTSVDLVAKHREAATLLADWLLRHGSNVAQLSIREGPQWSALCLPTSQLTQLEQLHCQGLYMYSVATSIRNSNGSVLPVIHQGSLSHLTRLTSLQLECCTLRRHAGQALQALSSLSQLQRLALVRVEVPDDDEQDAGVQLGHVLSHLVQLTHLTLKHSPAADTALQHISCLQGLKELTLDCESLTSASFTALPLSLTLLDVKDGIDVKLTSSTAPALAQLTALQHLDLEEVGELEPALLSGFVGLRHLCLYRVWQLVPEGSAGTAALLAAVGQMTALQHLDLDQHLRFRTGNIPAAACAALTASSQLTCLKVYDGQEALPLGAGRFMFAKERQQPSLQVLEIQLTGTPPGAAAEAGQLSDCQHSLNSIASSCPRLRELGFTCGGQVKAPLQLDCLQLSRGSLTRLELELINYKIDGARAATTLAALTGLQNLRLVGSQHAALTIPDLLQLTRLQQLEDFQVSCVRSDDGRNRANACFCNEVRSNKQPWHGRGDCGNTCCCCEIQPGIQQWQGLQSHCSPAPAGHTGRPLAHSAHPG